MQTLYNELGKYFDLIAAASSSVDTDKEVSLLKAIFDKYNVSSVLDIACGTGRHSVALAKYGYDVVGIDYADELLKVARTKADRPNVQFLQQDVSNIELDGTFDAAICMWSTFGELPYEQMLVGLKKVLKPNGVFVIDTRYFSTIPTGEGHKTYTNEGPGITIKTEIDEIFRGKTRIREIIYTVNGKKMKDHSEMDMFTEEGYTQLLGKYGFQHRESFYDYSANKTEDTRHIQMVFTKQ